MNTQLSSAKQRRVTPRVRLVVVSLVVGVGLAALALTRLNLSRSLHALTNIRPGFGALTLSIVRIAWVRRRDARGHYGGLVASPDCGH